MPRKAIALAMAGFGITALMAPQVTGQDAGAVTAPGRIADPVSWQSVVSGQIEALRSADGAGALSLAGPAFQATGASPQTFLAWVAQSGYGPIMDSERHRFETFQVIEDDLVIQHVTIVGSDLRMYSATYQLQAQPEGWRVEGVLLEDRNALAI